MSPLATPEQAHAEQLALRLIERPEVRSAREAARALLRADPVADTPDGRAGLDRALDQWVLALAMRAIGDPHRPAAVWNVYNAPRNWFGHSYLGAAVAIDNPDNVNREMAIDGASTYRISGRFSADPAQFMIEIVAEFNDYHGLGRTLKALTSRTMEAGADGRFTIKVGGAESGPNHLPTEKGALWIFARDSLSDWRQRPAELAIERVAGPPAARPRDEDALARDIAANMPGWVGFWRGFKDGFLGHPEPNRLVGPQGRPGGWGWLAGGRFDIAGDEVVVVTLGGREAGYKGFQITDPWTIAPDPVHRTASLNKGQALSDPDGNVTYVVAARDPGVHNWIDTVGLRQGWMLTRWQGVPDRWDPATLIRDVRLVKLAELDAALPHGTPRATLESRAEQIARRIAEHGLRTMEGAA